MYIIWYQAWISLVWIMYTFYTNEIISDKVSWSLNVHDLKYLEKPASHKVVTSWYHYFAQRLIKLMIFFILLCSRSEFLNRDWYSRKNIVTPSCFFLTVFSLWKLFKVLTSAQSLYENFSSIWEYCVITKCLKIICKSKYANPEA